MSEDQPNQPVKKERRRLSATMQSLRKVYEGSEEVKVEEKKRNRPERRMSAKVLEAKQFYEGTREGTRTAKNKDVEGEQATDAPEETTPSEPDPSPSQQPAEPDNVEAAEPDNVEVENKDEAPAEEKTGEGADAEVEKETEAAPEAEKPPPKGESPAEEAPAEEAPVEEMPTQDAPVEDPGLQNENNEEPPEAADGKDEKKEPEVVAAQEDGPNEDAAPKDTPKEEPAAEDPNQGSEPAENNVTEEGSVQRKSITAALLSSETKTTMVDKVPFGLTASNLLVIRVWGEAKEKGIQVGDTVTKVNKIPVKSNRELRELFADSPPPFPIELKVGTEERVKRAKEILESLDEGKPTGFKKNEDEILSRRPSTAIPGPATVVEGKAFKKGLMGRGTRYLKLMNNKIFYAHNAKHLDSKEKLEALEKEFAQNMASKNPGVKLKLKNNVVIIPIAQITEVKKSPGGSGVSITVGVDTATSRTYTFEGERGTTTVFDKWSQAIKTAQRRIGRYSKK